MKPKAQYFCLLLLSAGLLRPLSALPVTEPKRVIGVEFKITASDFVRNLRSGRTKLEEKFSKRLAALGNERLGFLDWQPVTAASDRSRFPALLKVSLDGEAGSGMAEHVFLRLTGQSQRPWAHFDCGSGERPEKAFQGIPTETLFSSKTPQPTGNKDHALENYLETRLRELFQSQDFHDNLTAGFLGKVPICNRVEQRAGDQRIAIPLADDSLAPGEGTVMKVQLCTRVGRSKEDAVLELGLSPNRNRDEWNAWVQTIVSRFDFMNIHANGWDAGILTAFRSVQQPNSLDVFMTRFQSRRPSTRGNLVVNPGGGR